MLTLFQDLRYALRQLIRNPGFALTAVLSLAIGIGATTAVFSVVDAALIHPYPYAAVDRIVRLTVQTKTEPGFGITLNGPQIQELRKLSIIDRILVMNFRPLTLTGSDIPESVDAIDLISSGFSDLGVPAAMGRGLLPSDAVAGQDPQPVVLLSNKFWREHYFSDPDVVGKTIELDRKRYTIVGVASPRFTWYLGDLYLPLKLTQDPASMYVVNMRLKPGVTLDAANAAIEPLLNQFAHDMPKHFPENFRVRVETLNEWVVRSIGHTLYLLFGAVAVLLAIGCGNVSILLMARGTARQHELAVRVAVGAQRRRIIRQLLTEAMLLAAVGGALGVLAAYGMLAGVKALLPKYAFAPEVVVRINLPVLWFSVAVALLTGFVFGLWPALELSRIPVARVMQAGVRRAVGSVSGRRMHSALVAGQVALTLLLLAGAGSAMEGFMHLMHARLGYDPSNVMSVGIPLHQNMYTTWAARAAYFEELREKVAEMPGVTMAAISTNGTPPRSGFNSEVEILGQPIGRDQTVSIDFVNPDYFTILRVSLLSGNIWGEAQNKNGAHVAVVNRTFAQRYFPKGDAIGHSFRIPKLEDRPPVVLSIPNLSDTWLQIVGIVEDLRNDGLRDPVKPSVFVPYTLQLGQWTQILVKSNGPPLALLHAVQMQLASINPEQQGFSWMYNLNDWISNQPEWQEEHLAAWIFGVLAWLALALVVLGLYSVVSYTVAQRTGEFGIRMALGAQRGAVVRVALASTLGSVGAGIVLGLVLAVSLNRVLGNWAQSSARDPLILLSGALVMAAVSCIACTIPARRASEIDPMEALRSE